MTEDEVREALKELREIFLRGQTGREWDLRELEPDEYAAYHNAGGWTEGRAAVEELKLTKAERALQAHLTGAQMRERIER